MTSIKYEIEVCETGETKEFETLDEAIEWIAKVRQTFGDAGIAMRFNCIKITREEVAL